VSSPALNASTDLSTYAATSLTNRRADRINDVSIGDVSISHNKLI
jgi:hypothetical protein